MGGEKEGGEGEGGGEEGDGSEAGGEGAQVVDWWLVVKKRSNGYLGRQVLDRERRRSYRRRQGKLATEFNSGSLLCVVRLRNDLVISPQLTSASNTYFPAAGRGSGRDQGRCERRRLRRQANPSSADPVLSAICLLSMRRPSSRCPRLNARENSAQGQRRLQNRTVKQPSLLDLRQLAQSLLSPCPTIVSSKTKGMLSQHSTSSIEEVTARHSFHPYKKLLTS